MAWQDELRRLDDELAAGRISADDYRSRRDQILSTAVSPGGQPAAGGATVGESTTMIPPVPAADQQPSAPQPAPTPPVPPQTAQPTPQGNQAGKPADDADSTQIVNAQDLGDSDRTQAVSGWRATPPDDSARTQIVPGVPPQAHAGQRPLRPAPPAHPSPPGGFPQPNQPPWQQQQQDQPEDLAPPWAGQEFPPLAAAGTPDWARTGPELFEADKKPGLGKKLGVTAIVVVLLAVAAVAYFLFRPDGNEEADQGGGDGRDTEQSQPTTPTSEEPPGPVVELPGDPENMSKIKTYADVAAIEYLTAQEKQIYSAGTPGEAVLSVSNENGVRIIVLYVKMESAEAAATARDALQQAQIKFGLAVREAPEGVLAAINEQSKNGPLLRAHYASGDALIRVQTQGEDGAAANELFDQVIDDQLERLPADG